MMLNHQCVFVTILWDFYLHGFLTSTTSEKGDNDIQKIENPTETVMVEAKKIVEYKKVRTKPVPQQNQKCSCSRSSSSSSSGQLLIVHVSKTYRERI